MSQGLLFAASPLLLVDDVSGRIEYRPGFIELDRAENWFLELVQAVPWRRQQREMYERTVEVPRLTASYALPSPALPGAVAAAAARVQAHVDVRFNSAGLNLYRDGADSVAPHNDRLDELVFGRPIALLSLGATRRMSIRSKAVPRRVLDLDLEAGSLLLMDFRSQRHYDHGIPKTAAAVGPRISIAFRVRRTPG